MKGNLKIILTAASPPKWTSGAADWTESAFCPTVTDAVLDCLERNALREKQSTPK